jgi:hypothetical protein
MPETEDAQKTALDTLYIVDSSNNEVTLEVIIGDREQTGDMTVRLDGEIIADKHAGDLEESVLGTNNTLNGKKLSIVATITDTSRTTNFTSLTIRLRGGFFPVEHILSKTVDEEGASANYLSVIEFFKP